MDCNSVKPGMTIVTGNLRDTRGIFVKSEFINNRISGAKGVVGSYVPGHGGDVWWVRHEDDKVAVYMFTEMESAEPVKAEAPVLTDWGVLMRLVLRQAAKFNERVLVRCDTPPTPQDKPRNPFYTPSTLYEETVAIFNESEYATVSYNDISAVYKLLAEKDVT